jgi:hypothetical protein
MPQLALAAPLLLQGKRRRRIQIWIKIRSRSKSRIEGKVWVAEVL